MNDLDRIKTLTQLKANHKACLALSEDAASQTTRQECWNRAQELALEIDELQKEVDSARSK